MSTKDGATDDGGADSDVDEDSDSYRTESERGVLAATNDGIAAAWTLFAIGASAYLFATSGSLPIWLQIADFVSIAATAYWAYGRGAFSAAGGFFKKVLN